jgi:hypothetical protein
MKFLEWNNLISSYFFNSANAGKDIYLYLTKTDVINIGRKQITNESDNAIWNDFLTKIKSGLPGSKDYPDIIDKALYSYQQWKQNSIKSIEGIELKYPPYISYLVFAVLPLNEIQGSYNTNNYYDRLDDFLKENNITQNLRGKLREIDALWPNLSNWANILNNGEQGFFRLRNFTNQTWIYVGKVFSQCVFPPRAIKKLPELFLEAGMVPDSSYQTVDFKRYLLQYGSSLLLLPNNVLEIVRRSESNELGQSIIETVKTEYNKWTGESHVDDEVGFLTKRNDIVSRVYLQFQLFPSAGRFEHSFRIKSANGFPEDLNFEGILVEEERGGFSGTFILPFKESFQLKDDFNKWIAKFPLKNVRLFVSAASFQLSADYWIETDTISKVQWMYLLCKNSKREEILTWGKSKCARFEDESDYDNIPKGHSLFKLLNPRDGLDGIPELTLEKEKSIQLVSSLRIDFRTFTNDFLPEIEIINSDGTETVYLQYKNTDEKIILRKKHSETNRWLLPQDVALHVDFNVRTEKETLSGNETAYRIVSSNHSAASLDENKLPKRDAFGRIAKSDTTVYSIGSNIVGSNLIRQIPYHQLFRGKNEDLLVLSSKPNYVHSEGNILLSYLTLKGECTAQDFYAVFEFLHSKYYGDRNHDGNFNYSKVKKSSLNFFDYLGYLDYEYESKSIVVNPPQLILIPTSKGRKVLLIGGRDESLVNAIIETAPTHNLTVEINRQFHSNQLLLLPDAITIKSFGTAKENFGENNLIGLAADLNIKFNPADLVQVGLQDFCSDIDLYQKDLLTNKESTWTYEDWATYIFNPNTLQLDKSFSKEFDKAFALLEYRLRPWEFYYRLWVNQKCYDIDRNWGKYVALRHFNKHVILYDREKEKVAIPHELPLPRLLSESIVLLSGLAPVYANIEGRAYRVFENIPSIFIQNLFDKLKQKVNYFKL